MPLNVLSTTGAAGPLGAAPVNPGAVKLALAPIGPQTGPVNVTTGPTWCHEATLNMLVTASPLVKRNVTTQPAGICVPVLLCKEMLATKPPVNCTVIV